MAGFLQTVSEDLGKLILRIAVGGLMLFHGVFKLTHPETLDFVKQMLADSGLPGFVAYGVYVGEIVAPLLILLGVRARLAALVVAFNMLMAIGLVLRQQVFALKEMGGGWAIELDMFFILGALAIFFLGAGRFGVMNAKPVGLELDRFLHLLVPKTAHLVVVHHADRLHERVARGRAHEREASFAHVLAHAQGFGGLRRYFL
jgi:putative oxidoreductase